MKTIKKEQTFSIVPFFPCRKREILKWFCKEDLNVEMLGLKNTMRIVFYGKLWYNFCMYINR